MHVSTEHCNEIAVIMTHQKKNHCFKTAEMDPVVLHLKICFVKSPLNEDEKRNEKFNLRSAEYDAYYVIRVSSKITLADCHVSIVLTSSFPLRCLFVASHRVHHCDQNFIQNPHIHTFVE